MANGAHIILDCTGIVGVEGSWMLSLMEQAVDLSGARGFTPTLRILMAVFHQLDLLPLFCLTRVMLAHTLIQN